LFSQKKARFNFLQSHKGKEEWRILEIQFVSMVVAIMRVYLGGLVPVLLPNLEPHACFIYSAESACMAGISVQTTPS
jgi:hypothetical protein